MRSKYSWLLLPPVLALIVFFGPMQSLNNSSAAPANKTAADASGNSSENETASAARPDEAPAGDFRSEIGSQLPEIPDLWQIGCTLIGVVLLGSVVVVVLKKFKENSGQAPGTILRLRQSLRLSPKHHVHIVQFEDRVLLLGASDSNLTVLLDTDDAGIQADEADIARRAVEVDPDEDGAVPRDMILPRPDRKRQKLPKRPRSPRQVPTTQTPARRPSRVTTQRAATGNPTSDVLEGLSAEKLADFRALLKKVRQGAGS